MLSGPVALIVSRPLITEIMLLTSNEGWDNSGSGGEIRTVIHSFIKSFVHLTSCSPSFNIEDIWVKAAMFLHVNRFFENIIC